jgi:hypothetical protein
MNYSQKSPKGSPKSTSQPKAQGDKTESIHAHIIPSFIQGISAAQSLTPSKLAGVLGIDGAKVQFWVNFSPISWPFIKADLVSKTEQADKYPKTKVQITIHGKTYIVLSSKIKRGKGRGSSSYGLFPWGIKDPIYGIVYRFNNQDSAHQHEVPDEEYLGQSPNITVKIPAKTTLAHPDLRVLEQVILAFVTNLTQTINSWQLERLDIAFDVLNLNAEIPCYLRQAQACSLTTRDGTVYGDSVGTYSGRQVTGFDSGRATNMRLSVYDKLHQKDKFKLGDAAYIRLLQNRWGQTSPDYVTRFEFQIGDTLWKEMKKSLGVEDRTAASLYANLAWSMKFLLGHYYVFLDAPYDSTYNSTPKVIWWWAEMTKAAQTWDGLVGHFDLIRPSLPPQATMASSRTIMARAKRSKSMATQFNNYLKSEGYDVNNPEVVTLVRDDIFTMRGVPDPVEVAQCVDSQKKYQENLLEDITKAMPWALQTGPPRPWVEVPDPDELCQN